MLHCVLTLCATLALLFGPASGSAAQNQPPPIGFDVLNNIELLPLLKDGVLCLQHSSYDRTGGNDDGFSGTYTALRRTASGEFVIFDAEGPGCIYRFWSAQPPEGHVKFFFDGESEPRLTCNFREMFQDKVPPFASPLTGQSSGGWYSYHPITFAKRCTIVTEKKMGFLAIAYHKYPEGTKVPTFTTELTPTQKKKYDAIQEHFADPSLEEIERNLELNWAEVPAGKGEFELAKLRGPATIQRLHMKLKVDWPEFWQQDHTFRKVVIRVYWDGDTKPAIECPIGELFGTGFGETRWNLKTRKTELNKYAAVPFGATDEFCYFRLPMPFRKSARITVENGTGKPQNLGWAVELKKGKVPPNAAYMHVQWRDYHAEYGKHVPILETTGRGHFVGTVLSMQSPYWLRYLEGDEKLYVDGEEKPSIHGTGTEDYFNCGWYFAKGAVSKPFHGITSMMDMQSRTSSYRMHVPDSVPFTKSLKVEIEHGESNNIPFVNYAIVAYWYQDSTSHDVKWKLPPANELRFPLAIAANPGLGTWYENEKWTAFTDLLPTLDVTGGLEAGGGKVDVVKYRQLNDTWDGPDRLLVTSDKPGAFVGWQVGSPRDDLYMFDLVAPRGKQFGIAEVFVDGDPTGCKIDMYDPNFRQHVYAGIGPFLMERGQRRLELRIVDKNEKAEGYDLAPGSYIMRTGGPWPQEWNVVGPFPVGNDMGYSAVHPPEKGVDLNATYTGLEGKEVAWKKLTAVTTLSLAGPNRIAPWENVLAYCHIYIKSPDDRDAKAYLSVDDAGKLFVNGELLWAVPGGHAIIIDQYEVPMKLKAGWNEVLIKVGQGGGNWGVAFRMYDPKRELTYSTTKEENN